MYKWQAERDNGINGRWTRRLNQDIKTWMGRKYGLLDFYMTQMLSGHCCFRYYLHRFRKLDKPTCIDCQKRNDDVENVMFRSGRWGKERRALEVELEEDLDPDTLISTMLKSRNNWDTVKRFMEHILNIRKQEEREQ